MSISDFLFVKIQKIMEYLGKSRKQHTKKPQKSCKELALCFVKTGKTTSRVFPVIYVKYANWWSYRICFLPFYVVWGWFCG